MTLPGLKPGALRGSGAGCRVRSAAGEGCVCALLREGWRGSTGSPLRHGCRATHDTSPLGGGWDGVVPGLGVRRACANPSLALPPGGRGKAGEAEEEVGGAAGVVVVFEVEGGVGVGGVGGPGVGTDLGARVVIVEHGGEGGDGFGEVGGGEGAGAEGGDALGL